MNWLQNDTPPLKTTIEDLPKIRVEEFQEEQPRRIDLVTPSSVIPLLVVKRETAERIIILNNGAVDLKRSQGLPIFQRSSWWREIEAHQIYVCDPGTLGPDALALNWFQAAPPEWPNAELAVALRVISERLGITRPSQRTYYGSSAGGFAALLQLCADKKANAIINNAQFDWTRWYANFVTAVLQEHFDGALAADVRKRWPHRANVLAYLARSPKPLDIRYHVNMASPYDKDIQLPIFETFLTEYPILSGRISIHHYFDERKGHNPLSKTNTLTILNQN